MPKIVRKHCGKQAEWRISLGLLQKKCGSSSTSREFRRLLTQIVEEDRKHSHMPDDAIMLNVDDMMIFHGRG